MKRRQFIALVGGAAVAWPLAGRAQQVERVRRIGILLPAAADDAEWQAWVGAFLQALTLMGWTIGRNVRIDTRWATTNAAEIRRHAAELAALAPDVILAHGTGTVGQLLQATRATSFISRTCATPFGPAILVTQDPKPTQSRPIAYRLFASSAHSNTPDYQVGVWYR
jgi:putative tryptophan/tyrosine transport system substrate-binding protein